MNAVVGLKGDIEFPVPAKVVGFAPTPLTLPLVAIKLVSKVLSLTITRLVPVFIHISTLLVSAMKLCGV